MHTLSFCILNDLGNYDGYGPVHVPIDNLDYETLKSGIEKIASPFLKYISNIKKDSEYYWDRPMSVTEQCDPSGYYFEKDYDVNDIVHELINNKYYCWNRYNKYYVIAFAIDYIRFSVFSKDCDKIVIKWRDEDQDDQIVPDNLDNNYNENPVISLLKKINNYE